MTKFLKLINHNLIEGQLNDLQRMVGNFEIIDLPEEIKKNILQSPDNKGDLVRLAQEIFRFCAKNEINDVLAPGGSPAFMCVFSKLLPSGIKVWFSHSVREFKEIKQDDGSIKKINVFRHLKWIKI